MKTLGNIDWLKICAVCCFLLCFALGSWLSLRRPLWNDEIYTQTNSMDKRSLQDILLIRFSEGNYCPLFYSIQKIICKIANYRFPIVWDGDSKFFDVRSQILLRLSSNIFISLALASFFYYFARHYSIGVGSYALLVSFSSQMLWLHWIEARPYALWFLLSTWQLLLFLSLLREKRPDAWLWRWLICVHFLLAFTINLSLAQIFFVSFLVWFAKDRPLFGWYICWKKYLFLTIIPMALCLFYYFYTPSAIVKYRLMHPFELIFDNISLDRFFIIACYFLFLVVIVIRRRIYAQETVSELQSQWREGRLFFIYTFFILLSAIVLLVIFKLRSWDDVVNASVSSRYFLFLTPVGIVAVTLFSSHMVRYFRNHYWMQINVIICIFGLTAIQILKTYKIVMLTGMY